VSAAAFACAHCGRPGISVIAKLVTSAATLSGWGAPCRFCGQRSRISSAAARAQFVIFLCAMASVPWLDGRTQLLAAYAAGAAILAVGFFAPMKKDLLS